MFFRSTKLDSIFKTGDITLPTKVRLVKAMVFPVVMYASNNVRFAPALLCGKSEQPASFKWLGKPEQRFSNQVSWILQTFFKFPKSVGFYKHFSNSVIRKVLGLGKRDEKWQNIIAALQNLSIT